MPTKETTQSKKTATKSAVKAKTTAKVSKGDSYVCEVCGLAVTVDEMCGCVDACDIICCNEPMKARKTTAKAKAA
jgi:hypothetical protein